MAIRCRRWWTARRPIPIRERPTWPAAEFIVGNPPFIGGKDIRRATWRCLRRGALVCAQAHERVSADFVMYWWDRAADFLRRKELRFAASASSQPIPSPRFSSAVMKRAWTGSIRSRLMAIPDHPWTKATRRQRRSHRHDGCRAGECREFSARQSQRCARYRPAGNSLSRKVRQDQLRLTIGADVSLNLTTRRKRGVGRRAGCRSSAQASSSRTEERNSHRAGPTRGVSTDIRPYRNGRDLTARPRGVMVIDLYGLEADEVRERYPEVYQHVLSDT